MALVNFGLHSEYERLTSVLLYRPGPEIGNYPAPSAIQHLRPIDQAALSLEFDAVIKTYGNLGIKVLQIDPAPLSDDRYYLYNMMYCRDLLFMTQKGAILANMANSVRKEEVLYAERALKAYNIPILHVVSGEGSFEGADALWVHDKLVAVGVGNRTNRQAYEQIKNILKQSDVECAALPSYQTNTQHLLGTVQIVDRDLALVRHEITDKAVIRFLEDHHFTLVKIPENREVRTRQAMNIVTVAPRTIVMTAGCPETRSIYLHTGLTIAAELDLSQLMHGAGGLACATGIISRS
jgi:N-dimethylarginine dimethylaminohydrolase